MKKLCRKGTVHPSPPIISDQLSFLPVAILTLTAALSPEEREVLAYLISCSNSSSGSGSGFQGHRKSTQQQKNGSVSLAKNKITGNNNNNNNDHPPLFTCDCFRCYMSYWVKWDASPNRQLIHEIIDAFEDHEMLHSNNKKVKNNKKDKKKIRSSTRKDHRQLKDQQLLVAESESVEENRDGDGDNDNDHEGCNNNKGEGEEKGSVRSFVSYIGERIWGVWG